MDQVDALISTFTNFDIQHIFREKNNMIDSLSKSGLEDQEGFIFYSYVSDGELDVVGRMALP